MLSYVFGFLGVALFPAILGAIGGHLATLAILDPHKKRRAIAGIWALALIGIVFAGLQQVLAYHSDKDHDEKAARLQSTTTGLETTLNTSLQRQEFIRGQLESISLMVGKVGEKSSDPILGQLAGAVVKMADNARGSSGFAQALSLARLNITRAGKDLDGQTIQIAKDNRKSFNVDFQTRNAGTSSTNAQPSARMYLPKPCMASAWQRAPSTDDSAFPIEYFLGQGAVPSISIGESWPWQEFTCLMNQDITEPIQARLRVFYGADKPAEASITIKP